MTHVKGGNDFMNYYDQLKKVELLISHFNKANSTEIKSVISGNPALRREFLEKISSIEWYYWMKSLNFFDVTQIGEGSNIIFWDVLTYLNKISEQVSQKPDELKEYGVELAKIIKGIIKFSKDNNKKVNSYHTWIYCIKILNNLPNLIVKENFTCNDFRELLYVITNADVTGGLIVSEIIEKLLGKFLLDKDMKEYAEAIIDASTQIRPKEDKESVSWKYQAYMMFDSYWLTEKLEPHYQKIGENCSLNVIYDLANKLKQSLEYRRQNTSTNISIGGSVYEIGVARVSLHERSIGKIEYKKGEYTCFIKQYSPEQLKNITIDNNLTGLYGIEADIEIIQFYFAANDSKSMEVGIKAGLPKNIAFDKAEDLDSRLGYMFEALYSDYLHVHFKSLANGKGNQSREAEDVLTVILRDVLLAKCEAAREEAKVVLNDFLSENYLFPIFRRMVLVCVDKFWPNYSYVLDEFLSTSQDYMAQPDYEVELYDIFKHHNSRFSKELKQKLKDLINNPSKPYSNGKYKYWWQYQWLSPLSDNSDFLDMYKKVKQKIQLKEDKPYEPERQTIQHVRFGGGDFSVTVQDILSKPIVDIVKYLKEFKSGNMFNNEPTIEGLLEAFQNAIKENPEKFVNEIELFNQSSIKVINGLLRGFQNAWKNNKELAWDKIFNFCINYLNVNKRLFIEKEPEDRTIAYGDIKHSWIITSIVDLISDGCKDDSHAYGKQFFEVTEQLFETIIPLLKTEQQPEFGDEMLYYALNTTPGRTIDSYINFSLRVSRAKESRINDWGKTKFQIFFDKKITEAYVWFGCYLPQMHYLDAGYTKQKVEAFSNKESSDFGWRAFMEGYLDGSRVYGDIYNLMRKNYLKVLHDNDFNERIDKEFVDHICIAYLYLGEGLNLKNIDGVEDSLFYKMLMEVSTSQKRDRWLKVIQFFWSKTDRTIKKEETQ